MILKKIIEYKKLELDAKIRRVPLVDIKKMASDIIPPIYFLNKFEEAQINIIAEVKKASPSLGVIRADFNPLEIAAIYEDCGAAALSVLTDENFFKGSNEYLKQIKSRVSIPCLRKDFTISLYDIYEARSIGADAILLIVSVLDSYQLKDFYDLALELGMQVLVEIHDESEWKKIEKFSFEIIGVNNRNLHDFSVDLNQSFRLKELIGDSKTLISESGLKSHEDLVALVEAGFNGFLIGETFMKEKDIKKKFLSLIKG